MALKKPVATIFCTADFRTDRCPAQIAGTEHPTVSSVCLTCEHAEVKLHSRGKWVVEIRDRDADLPRQDQDLSEFVE